MKTRKNTVKKTKTAWMLTFALLAGTTAGCVQKTEVPIIAETKAGDGSDAGETTDKAAGESAGSGGAAADSQKAEDFIRSHAEVPASGRYQTEVDGESLKIQADAAIQIPKVSRVPVLEMKHDPYESSDGERAAEILSEELGFGGAYEKVSPGLPLGQGVTAEPNSYVFSSSGEPNSEFMRLDGETAMESFSMGDGGYQLAFSMGTDSDRTPMIWLDSQKYSDGAGSLEGAGKATAPDMEEEELEALEQRLEEKAENLLKKMDDQKAGDETEASFTLQKKRWRPIAESSGSQWKDTGKYGLRLTYVRSFEGIPLVNKNVSWAGEAMSPARYVEILYMEDGVLLEYKDINRETVSGQRKETDYLMPFEAVCQVFEQYMRHYQSIFKQQELYQTAVLEEAEQAGISGAADQSCLYVDVSRVEFGYQLRYDEWDAQSADKGSGRGMLVPVWAFYGTMEAGVRQAAGQPGAAGDSSVRVPLTRSEGLLVTINAEDGTVYGK